MTHEDFEWAYRAFGIAGWMVAGTLVLVWAILNGYATKKGENQALREDIPELTQLQRQVEHGFNELLEQTKINNSLRLAALDRRLAAHQEAFVMWRKINAAHYAKNPSETMSLVNDGQTWWDANCLYLEPDVRQAFAVVVANVHIAGQLIYQQGDPIMIGKLEESIRAFPDILFRSIKLPAMTKEEQQVVDLAA